MLAAEAIRECPDARLPARETIRGVIGEPRLDARALRRRLVWLGRALDYVSFYVSCAMALLRLLRRQDIVVAKTDPPLISIVCAWVPGAPGGARSLITWQQDVFPEVATEARRRTRCPAALNRPLQKLRDGSLRAAASNVVLGAHARLLERTLGAP